MQKPCSIFLFIALVCSTLTADPFDDWVKAHNRFSQPTDGCTSVLGPIPEINCFEGEIIPQYFQGKKIEYHSGKYWRDSKPAPDFEQLHRADKPQLASPGMTGSFNARIGLKKRGPVEWVYICRSRTTTMERTDSYFAPIGLIGHNPNTGETCFTDLLKPTPPLKLDVINPSFCARCHSNNSPWLITPYLNQSAVGGDGSMDVMPRTLRSKHRTPGWGYRILNLDKPKSDYQAIFPKKPDGTLDRTCIRCHTINNQFVGESLVAESTGNPRISGEALSTYAKKFPHSHWMPPNHGLSSLQEWKAKYQKAIERIKHCVENESSPQCFERKTILSECPTPAPVEKDKVFVSYSDSESQTTLRWEYLNQLGGVKERDDVRFEIRIVGENLNKVFSSVGPLESGQGKWVFSHPSAPDEHYFYELSAVRTCFDSDKIRKSVVTKIPSERE